MHADAAMQQTEAAVTAESVTSASSALAPHRKRKERHESAGSSQIAQDRKVIRSNSQERQCEGAQELENSNDVPQKIAETMAENCADTPLLPLHEHNSPMSAVAPMEEEETEHERRRSSERFASFPRSSTPRTGGSNRRYHQPRRQRRSGTMESKENTQEGSLHHHHHHHHHHHQRHADENSSDNISHAFLQLHPQEECESRERSPSPATPRAVPPLLDLSTLLQQVDCAEPMPSQAPHHRVPEDSQVLLSPRNSMILTRRLDPNVAPSPPVEHSRRCEETTEGRAKQLTKHINSLKKKIKIFEEQFELQNGYRLSHADKLGNRELKKMFSDLSKLRKELKQIKEDVSTTNNVTGNKISNVSTQELIEDSIPAPTTEVSNLSETLHDLENRLQEKRDEAGRPDGLEDMSREELLAEKVALQKALLSLENKHGRPVTRTDRDLVRPLYDRYRSLKRLVIRSGGSKLRDSMSELATILEHETMDFTATPEAASESAAVPADAEVTAELPSESSNAKEPQIADFSENLHSLPLSELLSRQQEAREEKKRLRRALREFEEEFQRDTGRRLQREDREPRQQEYASYKQAKAKLRLLEALVAKHGQGFRSC